MLRHYYVSRDFLVLIGMHLHFTLPCLFFGTCRLLHLPSAEAISIDDDDDDEGRINFSMALSPKTTRTRNNKLKQ